jgi:hypothetical protein
MTLIKKVALGAAGIAGFVVACVAAALLSSVVSALVPGRSPDAPGELDETIEDRARREHKTTLTNKEEPKTNESHNETAIQEESLAPQEASTPQEVSPLLQAAPAPAPIPVAPPAPPARGPGNFDAPPAPSGGGSYQTGPGNM